MLWESRLVGKREMDEDQRGRLRELKRWTWWGVLISGAFLVLTLVVGRFAFDDWTALLLWGSLNLVLTIVILVAQWRYIRRGPFPRLPASMRDGDDERPRQ